MDLLEAIRTRRAVQRETVLALIESAGQAPSAINRPPWAIAVVQDPAYREEASGEGKAYWQATLADDGSWDQLRGHVENPEFNLFYNAATLVIIYARPDGLDPEEDCCLAAEHLMLAVHGMGLGTCPIGLGRPWLGRKEVKKAKGVPESYSPIFPVILGYPQGESPAIPRRLPEILCWHGP